MPDTTETPISRPDETADDALPGDPDRRETIARMIRVDQAGEYGAVRIYEGQLAVLRGTEAGDKIEEMLAQEHEHLASFNEMILDRRVRPTALQPLWHLAGFALGAATAAMGSRAAMACTVAVEEVIGAHYGDQADRLGEDETPLREKIETFRDDELGHLDTAVEHGAYETPGYEVLAGAVKAGSRLAIWLSTRF